MRILQGLRDALSHAMGAAGLVDVPHDAELYEAAFVPSLFSAGDRLCGRIYGDRKGRFIDGTKVLTTAVKTRFPGDIFRTRNTTYKVKSWAIND